jgi:hypothetical protein
VNGVFGDPVWQGIGLAAAIAAFVAYVVVDVLRGSRRRTGTDTGPVRSYHFTGPRDVANFYHDFIQAVDAAQEKIYRSGDGFSADRGGGLHERLLEAEARALARGVEMTRIQTSPRAFAPWANGLARLLREHQLRFRVWADFDGASSLDFGVFDPHGANPVVVLLFSELELSLSGPGTRTSAAIFLYGNRGLATQLARGFESRSQSLPPMAAADVEALGTSAVFFAYGPHMTGRHMRHFAPDAIRLGAARLPGWRLVLGDTGEPERVAVRIEHTGDPDDAVQGVTWQLSSWARDRLRALERGPYQEVEVRPVRAGEEIAAFAFVRMPSDDPTQWSGPAAHLEIMIEGARENHYDNLVEELRRYQLRHQNPAPPVVPRPREPQSDDDQRSPVDGGEDPS